MTERKHLAIIKGEARERSWETNSYGRHRGYSIEETHKIILEKWGFDVEGMDFMIYYTSCYETTIEKREVWRGEIPKPTLIVGEELWINDLELLVKITKKYRTTNGETVYETNHVIESIKSKKTEESRLKAIEKWFTLSYPTLETFEQLKKEFIQHEEAEEEIDITENEIPSVVNSENEIAEKEHRSGFWWLNPMKIIGQIKSDFNK